DDNFQSQIYDADNTQYSEANGKNILQLGLGLNLFGYNQYANGDENAQSQEINEASTQSQVANGKNVAQLGLAVNLTGLNQSSYDDENSQDQTTISATEQYATVDKNSKNVLQGQIDLTFKQFSQFAYDH